VALVAVAVKERSRERDGKLCGDFRKLEFVVSEEFLIQVGYR
jgi:hypothetical protein